MTQNDMTSSLKKKIKIKVRFAFYPERVLKKIINSHVTIETFNGYHKKGIFLNFKWSKN